MIGAACITAGLLGGTAGWASDNGALLCAGFFLILVGLACWLKRDYSTNHAAIYDQRKDYLPWH